jgi:AbrB family looped-hinge helix DNA binding protein
MWQWDAICHAIWYGRMASMTVTMDKAGRIVLPKPLRDQLHLEPGDEFAIRQMGSQIHLEPQRPEGRIVYKSGIPVLVFDSPAASSFDVVEEINRAREERADYVDGVGGYDRDDLG